MRRYNKHKNDNVKTIDDVILSVLDDEFDVAERNESPGRKDFTDFYNMVHCLRDKKANEWESDIYLPEFSSRMITQVGNFVAQYFSSRDYVESDSDSDDPKDVAEGKASKKLLNLILNDKKNYYYEKIVRLLMFALPGGYGILKGGYSQRVDEVQVGVKTEPTYLKDEFGNFLTETGDVFSATPGQRLGKEMVQTPVYDQRIVEDRPIFDVYPIQRVYMSKEYAYSLNDKEYVIFETDKTLDRLKDEAAFNNYTNLDKIEAWNAPEPAQRNTTTSNVDEKFDESRPVSPKLIIRERWGKWPVVVTKRDPTNNKPIEYKPGIDKDGEWLDKAELQECILTNALKDKDSSDKVLIRFQVSPHSKRPMARFKCYIDSLKDSGFGDGEVNYEIQTAINDVFNLGNYRTKLAVTPAFKSKRFAGIPQNVRLTPEKSVELENMDDLQLWDIKDNIQGHMYQGQMLTSRMDYAMATSPTTMGMSADRRETATVASITNDRANIRQGLKTLTLEFTGFTEFYDMILTLVNDFMLPETLEKLLGEDAYNYNPKREDRFKPVSQAIETEESKSFKIRMYEQVLGRIVNLPNPKTPQAVNYIIGQMLELMGGDFKHFKKFMFSEDLEANLLYLLATGGKSQPMQPSMGMGGGPQNQTGLPQGQAEQQTRMS